MFFKYRTAIDACPPIAITVEIASNLIISLPTMANGMEDNNVDMAFRDELVEYEVCAVCFDFDEKAICVTILTELCLTIVEKTVK
jgi:hypothetical protein